jgi:uncharacterized protein YjiS (DUF1127 family)
MAEKRACEAQIKARNRCEDINIPLNFSIVACTRGLAALQQNRWRVPALFLYSPETISASAEAPPGERIRIMFASLARLLQSWRRSEEAKRELSHLSDRELADIGITRSDIERIASGYGNG